MVQFDFFSYSLLPQWFMIEHASPSEQQRNVMFPLIEREEKDHHHHHHPLDISAGAAAVPAESPEL